MGLEDLIVRQKLQTKRPIQPHPKSYLLLLRSDLVHPLGREETITPFKRIETLNQDRSEFTSLKL